MHEPRVQEIMEALLERIQAGEYAIGSRLPSERDLANEYQSGRDTVRGAIQVLERRGYVRRRGTAGTIVLDWKARQLPSSPENIVVVPSGDRDQPTSNRPPRPTSHSIPQGIIVALPKSGNEMLLSADLPVLVSAPDQVSLDLELPSRSLVMKRRRIYGTRRSRPFKTVESYYPADQFLSLFQSGVDDESLDAWLREHFEPNATYMTDDIEARNAESISMATFDLPVTDDVVFKIRRRFLDLRRHVIQVDYITVAAALSTLRLERRLMSRYLRKVRRPLD